jgi:class 3 adenylate cyclase/tetratricopeptide (TPR) repeat protein
VLCADCATALPAGARFCHACGTRQQDGTPAPVGTPAETRKVVTVVFCDLVGSTALSGRLDSEILRAVTLRYFAVMRERLEACGGTVEKFIGDAVMAVFGVPQMHEDDALRALTAATGMLAALDAYNVELSASHGIRLTVRIGVNTGEVVAGSDSSVRQALVSGEVVNIAARLEQHAPPGTVLIGPQTRLAVGAAAVVEPTAPLDLKGLAEPMTAYRLLRLGDDDPELLRRFDVPFIGRERELALLDAVLARVSGRSAAALVLLDGDAGIGKTRLLREWTAASGRAGAVADGGRCHSYRDRGSLAPLADAVRAVLTAEGAAQAVAADPDAAGALAALAGGMLHDGTPRPSLAEATASSAAVLRALARERTVVLTLDDCQWADPTLWEAVGRLHAALHDSPVLLVCAGRPELGSAFGAAVAATRAESPGASARSGLPSAAGGNAETMPVRLTVPTLGPDESALMAAELSGEVAVHAADSAVARAEGNPFLLEQLLAAAADASTAGGDIAAGAPLPVTVQALLATRVDALPASERALLDQAAVLGREFDRRVLDRLGPGPADAAPAPAPSGGPPSGPLLTALAQRRLVERVSGTDRQPPGAADLAATHRFGAALVHQVAYEGAPKLFRSDLHARVADLLAADGAPDAVVGGHLERAHGLRTGLGLADDRAGQLRVRAADRLLAAGRAALSHGDLSWAEDLLSRAGTLSLPGGSAWTEATARLGETLLLRGSVERGEGLLHAAAEAADRNGDRLAAAHVGLTLAALGSGGGVDAAAEAARAALPVFEAAGDDSGQARALLRLAQQEQAAGRHSAALGRLEGSLAAAVRAEAEPERAMVLGAVGVSLWLGPLPATAGTAAGIRLLAEHGPGRRVVRLTLNCPLAVLHALGGRPEPARACLAEAERMAAELGYLEAQLFLPVFIAQVDVLAGRPTEARDRLLDAVAAVRPLGETSLLASASRELARVLLDLGDTDGAREAMRSAGTDPAPAELADRLGLSARLAALDGAASRALADAGRAVDAARRTDSPPTAATAALDLAETLHTVGDRRGAVLAARQAVSVFAAKGHTVGVARASDVVHREPPRSVFRPGRRPGPTERRGS